MGVVTEDLGVFAGYRLLRRLGQGGMAEVFIAHSLDVARSHGLVVLKRLRRDLSDDPSFVRMFQREAKLAASLHHRHICTLLDYGSTPGELYLALEFVHGRDLSQILRVCRRERAVFSQEAAVYVGACIAEALDDAHRSMLPESAEGGLVHRDVSPHNVVVSFLGVPKLIDFGIAKVEGALGETQHGRIRGKFAYMSPEQALGQSLDGRSDIFSLGMVLLEALAWRQSFNEADARQFLKDLLAGGALDLWRFLPKASPELVACLGQALAYRREDRFLTAGNFADALRDCLRAGGVPMNQERLSAHMRRIFAGSFGSEHQELAATRATLLQQARLKNRSGEDTVMAEPSEVFKQLGSQESGAFANNLAKKEMPKFMWTSESSTTQEPPLEVLSEMALMHTALGQNMHVDDPSMGADLAPNGRRQQEKRGSDGSIMRYGLYGFCAIVACALTLLIFNSFW